MLKKGKQKSSTSDDNGAILIEESGESFSASQLKEAVKAAIALASTKSSLATVSIPFIFMFRSFYLREIIFLKDRLI